MTKLRIYKLFIILGFPFLGWLYAFQFSGAFDPAKRDFVTPFKPFLAPVEGLCPGEKTDKCRDDQKISLTDQTTKKIKLVSFWATWCAPCVEEFPAMIELQSKLSDEPFEIVFVSINENWNDVREFYKKHQIQVKEENSLWDSTKTVAQKWGSQKFPESYVVRPDGWVVEKVIGAQQWTRPAVVKYFQDLVAKYVGIKNSEKTTQIFQPNFMKSILSFVMPRLAIAQGGDVLSVDPLIHEQDKKNLELLRKNIEIASDNLSKAEGAYKEEERNLNEQKIVRDRRNKDLSVASDEMEKVSLKGKEIDGALKKTMESLDAEKNEKARVEAQIKSIQLRIKDLEKRLEEAKDELTQTSKTLNTRMTNIETLEKAEESTKEEADSVKSKLEKARSVVTEKRVLLLEVEKDISIRDRKLRDIGKTVENSKLELQKQKKKLADFEQVLKK